MTPNTIICFEQDTKERKRWFKSASFAHPAKMVLGLQIYLIEHYTKPGDWILDPMGGSGTILVACALGRNVICVELEKKFVKMQKDNWEKVKSLGPMLGYKMGQATILQGDARNLNMLVDKCIFSPPYAESLDRDEHKVQNGRVKAMMDYSYTDKKHGKSNGQIASLPYGEISAVISSPPFGEAQKGGGLAKNPPSTFRGVLKNFTQSQGDDINNISKLPYADAVITSPPYEESVGHTGKDDYPIIKEKSLALRGSLGYGDRQNENIGNLKSENYLEAMLQVYRQCHRVLKDKGLLVLVVKNFIRDKKIVRLDLDTIKLCEKAGFVLKERLKRKLTQQSFWRIIYQKKFPNAPKIEFEDVLIFEKVRPLFKDTR